MNRRLLIVNADDFGMTTAGDAAIAELFAAGAITSSTILAPACHAAAACETAAQKKLAVGVHWTLHAEWSDERWLAVAGGAAPSLGEEGALLADAARMAKQAKAADVERELEAQWAFLAGHGCPPDHADSHGGTLYGINGRLFFLCAFAVCRRHGLPFRFPKQPGFLRRQLGGLPFYVKAAHLAIVGAAALYGVPLPDELVTDPRPVASIENYQALRDYYFAALQSCGSGVTEVFLHPSQPDDALLQKTGEWQKRVWEYQLLQSGDLRDFASREGFAMVSWGDAFAARPKA